MNNSEYYKKAQRTMVGDMDAVKNRLGGSTLHLLHAAIGLSTEANELLDMVKKHLFYGAEIDMANLEEEIGDLAWYQSLALYAASLKDYPLTMDNVLQKNIDKLEARYGYKFSEDKAKNRDLKQERAILERSK